MILIGACRQSKRAEAALAVVEASLSGGRKRYSLLEIDQGLDADPAVFVEGLHRRLKDGSLWRRKRLFSQDRRPKKTLPDHPRVVALEDGAGIVDGLRDRGVVVEAIRFSAVKKWRKEFVGKALGANYDVDPKDMLTVAAAVFKDGRVDRPGPGVDLKRVSGVFSASAEDRVEAVSASVLALALLLWFREKVPYRRAYRAN